MDIGKTGQEQRSNAWYKVCEKLREFGYDSLSYGGLTGGESALVFIEEKMGGTVKHQGVWSQSIGDYELISPIDPVTFKSGGKTYEPTGEFRVPNNADDGNDEWFYCPEVGHIMHNSAQEAYGNYGKNRIILREVEKKERLLTKLVAGLTVKCNACDCDGVVGELYCTGIPGGTMWFHEGQSEANNPAFAVAVKMGGETIWGANIEGNITVVEEN